MSICFLDSIHFKTYNTAIKKHNRNIVSLLDIALYPIGTNFEKSYTEPFAKYKFKNKFIKKDNKKRKKNLYKIFR